MDAPDPAPPPQPSSAPSWVILGFILGVLCALALPRRQPAPPPRAPAAAPPRPQAVPRLTTVEAVFAVWGKYAVWDQDITEVALWNSTTRDYSDCYEVLRAGDALFFRSIPRLTRPLLTHGLPDAPDRPLEYTETEAQREEWLRESGQQNWNVLRQTLRGGEPPAP